jgi:tetratricopeptide (TPR) repeat protein
LRVDPNNEKAHASLGMALGVKGDWDGEIVEEREAMRLNPNDEPAHVNLGLALGAKHDWDAAIAEFREALRLNPKDASAHGSLGLVLGIKGDSDEAITEFRQALSLNPNDANAYYGLGLALEKKGDRAGALEEFRSAYELNSNNSNYREAYDRLLNSATTTTSSKEQHNWERGKVIAQDLSSSRAGTYAGPIGTATVAVPIYRRSNTVVIETDNYRYEWSEVGRSLVVLPVNGFVDFYRDGNWFIVLDSKQKKHKFTLVSMTARRQEK